MEKVVVVVLTVSHRLPLWNCEEEKEDEGVV